MFHTEYRIQNLAELLEACEAIMAEVNADNEGSVDPHEVLIDCDNWNNVTIIARSHTLTDKSTVYDVRFPILQAPRIFEPVAGAGKLAAPAGWAVVGTSTEEPTNEDVCIAGNPAVDGHCDVPSCVCNPLPEDEEPSPEDQAFADGGPTAEELAAEYRGHECHVDHGDTSNCPTCPKTDCPIHPAEEEN